MTEKTTFSISEKEVLCLGKSYVLGQLFVDFLELDLTAYEAERLKIESIIKNNDETAMKEYTKDLKIPKKMQRGYSGLDYILLNITEDMSLELKYTIYAIYKALFLVDHVYFRVIDYSDMSKLNSKEILKAFDLVSLQSNYKDAMKKCLLKDTTENTPVQRYIDHKISVEGKAEVLFEISEAMTLYEVYTASNISSLLYVEFMKMVQNSVFVAKCENCGRYFAVKGKYDMKYCDRIAKGDTRTCQEIGAINSFKNKIKNDPVYGEYEKAYKRYYAQKRKGVITQEQFDNWAKNASKTKKEALKGNLSFDDFKDLISKI